MDMASVKGSPLGIGSLGTAMGKRERFALVAGILGFVVDVIALATFLAQGIYASAPHRSSSFSRVWSVLLLIYGWFLVSWILAQWKLTRRAVDRGFSRTKMLARDIIGSAVVAVGILLIPIAIMIGYGLMRELQGTKPPALEDYSFLFAGSLASMVVIGAGIFGAIYGLLTIINDEEDLDF